MTALPTYDNDSLIAWLKSHQLGVSCGPGVAINTFRADLIALLERAAAGRLEYAVNAPDDSALVLKDEARQLETVIRLVRGDITAMTAWLPSWRWTAEMCADLEPK